MAGRDRAREKAAATAAREKAAEAAAISRRMVASGRGRWRRRPRAAAPSPGLRRDLSKESDRLGREGEDRAARFLEQRGCRVVARRAKTPYGEIDLIAVTAERILFVEVKTRRSTRFGAPALAVDARRRERLRNAAHEILAKHPEWRGRTPRIDVIEVRWRGPDEVEIEHIEDAV